MQTDRRTMLKSLAAAAGVMTVVSTPGQARESAKLRTDAKGMLYDTTLCIGCKTCVVACKAEAGLPADVDNYGGGLYDAPEGLNEYTRNVIQLYKGGDKFAYVKKQCMHCVDPACVSACMLGALTKGDFGAVSWDGAKCVGCRYCQVACPFGVPQYEWTSVTPRIVKCDLCKGRLAKGKEPACVEVCPREAVISGDVADLIDEAHRRIAASPGRYVKKVYGEHDLGGTQVLYLADVEFEKLGFRFSDTEAVPQTQGTVQEAVYRGFVAPLALYAVLGTVMFRNRRAGGLAKDDEE